MHRPVRRGPLDESFGSELARGGSSSAQPPTDLSGMLRNRPCAREHAALLSGVEGGLGVARRAVTAGGVRRALDGTVAQRANQARVGRTAAMLDRIVPDDGAPRPGETPLLVAALEVLVVLFRIGERP